MEKNKQKPDYILLTIASLIILLGFVIFTSVSMGRMMVLEENISSVHFFKFIGRQFIFGLLPGILIGFILFKTPIEKIRKISPLLLILNLILVAMVFIPGLGITSRGATRWLSLGLFSFQPSEILKLTFILYLASWLSGRKKINKGKKMFSETLLAFGFVCAFISGLILMQPDLSTLVVIMLTGFVLYFSHRTPLSHILMIGGIGSLATILFITLSPYRLERVRGLISAGIGSQGLSYQAHQALIAIGSGGVLGLGFGMGNQKYGFLPFAISDSIFASYAEEAGFIGSLLLISLFLLFAWRGIKIAKRRKDSFLSLVAVGISFWIFFQAFVHIGAMVGILPITGIPLPFISHGRAHFVTELAGLGILLNISKS